jgi:hypothetical protein
MKKIVAKYKKRQHDITVVCQRVIDRMENNPVFPDPPAALAELKTLLPELQTALANAGGRDKQMVSIKNDKKANMLVKLQELCNYVTVTCNNDKSLILSSGFDATNATSADSNLPPSVETLEVVLGTSGDATTRAKSITGAKGYVHQYTKEQPTMNTEWIGEGSSKSRHTFEGLASEKRYWFRIVVIGTNGQRGYSPVVSRVIQ